MLALIFLLLGADMVVEMSAIEKGSEAKEFARLGVPVFRKNEIFLL